MHQYDDSWAQSKSDFMILIFIRRHHFRNKWSTDTFCLLISVALLDEKPTLNLKSLSVRLQPLSYCLEFPIRAVIKMRNLKSSQIKYTSDDKFTYMKIGRHLCFKSSFAFLMAQRVKNSLTMQETQEDSLEEAMATDSSILAWRIPWTEEPGELHSMGSQRMGHSWGINTFTLFTLFTRRHVEENQNLWNNSWVHISFRECIITPCSL